MSECIAVVSWTEERHIYLKVLVEEERLASTEILSSHQL
jgi:hypothetical protein